MVDFSTVICALDGSPLMSADGSPWTAGALAAEALLAPPSAREQAPYTVGKIVERHALAMRIFKGGEHDITNAEGTLIQESVAKSCAPIAAAQIIALTERQVAT